MNCPMCGELWNKVKCDTCGWFEGKRPKYAGVDLGEPLYDDPRVPHGSMTRPDTAMVDRIADAFTCDEDNRPKRDEDDGW